MWLVSWTTSLLLCLMIKRLVVTLACIYVWWICSKDCVHSLLGCPQGCNNSSAACAVVVARNMQRFRFILHKLLQTMTSGNRQAVQLDGYFCIRWVIIIDTNKASSFEQLSRTISYKQFFGILKPPDYSQNVCNISAFKKNSKFQNTP